MERLTAEGLQNAGGAIGRRMECLDEVGSTNDYLKELARRGAPHGTVVTAEEQTGGRGRKGRGFQSLRGRGLYLSVLLRPEAPPPQATDLTAWVAVAARRAVEKACGLTPDIKWINDLQIGGKKLAGILCEMETTGDRLDWVVAGIGINVSQTEADFGPELAPLATSLALCAEHPPTRTELARALLRELERVSGEFPQKAPEYLAEYEAACVTLGRPVEVRTPGGPAAGFAVGLTEDFRLRVALDGGGEALFSSGDVCVRPVDKGRG